MAEQNVTPIGAMLGSERLYDEHLPPPPQNLYPDPPPEPPKPRFASKLVPRGKPRKQPPQPTQEVAPKPTWADVNWRNIAGNALELAGIAAITAGCALIAIWLALIVGGVLLVLLGVATGMNVTQ